MQCVCATDSNGVLGIWLLAYSLNPFALHTMSLFSGSGCCMRAVLRLYLNDMLRIDGCIEAWPP